MLYRKCSQKKDNQKNATKNSEAGLSGVLLFDPSLLCFLFFFRRGKPNTQQHRAVSLLRACSVMIPNGKSVILAGFVSFQWTTLCTGRRRAPAFFVQVPWKGDIPAHGRHRARREQRTPLFSAAEKADTTRQVMVCAVSTSVYPY